MARLIDITGKPLTGEWGKDDDAGNGIPVLRTTNFTNEGVIDFSNVVTRTITKKNISEKYLRYGDIIIEKSGGSDKQPVGRVVYFEGENSKYLFNNFTGLLRVRDRERWFPRYIFYSLFARYQSGGTRPYENRTTGLHNLQTDTYINSIEISDLTFSQQKNVCSILDEVQSVVRKRQQQLFAFDNLIKARFVEMFGDPVSNSSKWEQSSLCDVTYKIGSGATPRGGKESYQAEGISLIRSMNVHDGRFEYKDLAHITDEQASQLDVATVRRNDVFINITGASVARTCIVPDDVLPARVNQHVAIIRCNDTLFHPVFANNLFLNNRFKAMLLSIGESGGATRQAITKQQLESLSVILPPIERQCQFASFASHIDKSKYAFNTPYEIYQSLSLSLTQGLIP